MAFQNVHKFTISVEGDVTGEKWHGEFSVKKLLPHGDQIAMDAKIREMLGTNPQFAAKRALNQAEILAELDVRILESPPWWAANGFGAGIFDDNLLKELIEQAQKPEREHREALRKKAESTSEALKKQMAESEDKG